MKRLICFIMGHRLVPARWMQTNNQANQPPARKWYRFWNCARCGRHIHTQFGFGLHKPVDVE